jgi:PhoH-like ATPase
VTRKTFVIDTNVLLHDPEAIKTFANHDIVIPLAVLEELDSIKRLSDEIGQNSRYAIRYIDSLRKMGNLYEGVKIEQDIRIRLHLDGKYADRKNFPLSLDRPTHKVLFVAYQMRESGKSTVLVSKDFLLRIKAEAIGIEAQDYENVQFSQDALYSGLRKLEVAKREIDSFYKEGCLPAPATDFVPNEYCILSCPEHSTAVCKYDHSRKQLIPLLKLQKDLWGIHPLNIEQTCALDLLLRDEIKLVTLIGQAGTGKTLLALAAGLKKVFDEGSYRRILVSRPIIPLGKDIGYLPGSKEEKLYHWMQPIYDNLEYLCRSLDGQKESGEATQRWLLDSKKLEMEAVTYIRGRSLPEMWMIIDEAQNLTPHELKAIISRAGHGTKVILTGDLTQIDNPYLNESSNGLIWIVLKLREHPLFGHMLFKRTERSELASLAAEVL